MKQTAVEWLKEQFDRQRFIEHLDFNKAKQMEKEQIEISNEEIENEAKVWNEQGIISSQHSFIWGARWYRKQIIK